MRVADALMDKMLAYHAGTPEEEAARVRILGHLRSGGALFDRHRWNGHLTGSAFLLDSAGARLLLIHHRKLDRWLQPGGHGEISEIDPLAVAMREATEETGVTGLTIFPGYPDPFDLDVHTIPARPDEPAHEHLDIRYVLAVPEDAVIRVDLAEVRAARWFSLEEAAGLPDVSVARVARKLLGTR